MNENEKSELTKLQKEMQELQKTIDELKNGGISKADLRDIPDDSNEDPKEDEMDIYCYQCFSSIRVKKDIPAGTVVTCPTCESQQKYWDCECPECHTMHHPDEPHPELAIKFNMMFAGKSEEDISAYLENLNKKCDLPPVEIKSAQKSNGISEVLPMLVPMMGLMTSSLNPKDIKEQNPKSGAENNNKNNEMESSGKLQGDMVCIHPKEDNRDNEMKTKALQGNCVDTSNSGLLGVLKKLFGK